MKSKKFLFTIIFPLILITKCAFIDVKLEPKFVKRSSAQINHGSGEKIYINKIINLDHPSVRGIVKNIYGMEIAKVYTDRTPQEILRSNLESELLNNGYTTVNKSEECDISIDIYIHQFFTEANPGVIVTYWGVVDSDIFAKISNSNKYYERRIQGVGKNSSSSFFVNEQRKVATEMAIEDFIIKTINSISDLKKEVQK